MPRAHPAFSPEKRMAPAFGVTTVLPRRMASLSFMRRAPLCTRVLIVSNPECLDRYSKRCYQQPFRSGSQTRSKTHSKLEHHSRICPSHIKNVRCELHSFK